MGFSLILSSYKRPELLNFGLSSVARQGNKGLEVIVVNDGVYDDTEKVCAKYRSLLDIKYIFSGHRNLDGDKPRPSGFALNIGIKASKYNIIILSCPEIFHLNNAIHLITDPLYNHSKYMTIPQDMYFDETGEYTDQLKEKKMGDTSLCELRDDHVQMPFLMGIWKQQILDIGGYDEDFTGYASEDNDFIDRLKLNGCTHHRTSAKIVHLFHGKHIMEGLQWENKAWAYNRQLYIDRKDIIVRNKNREWGLI